MTMPDMYWDKGRGEWRRMKPVACSGWKAHLEQWLRKKGMKRFANIMAAWDERGLGR